MHADRRGLAALFLVTQGGLALLAALGLLAYARVSHAVGVLVVPELLAFAGPIGLMCLAVGVLRTWPRTALGVYVWEGLTLLGAAFAGLTSAGASLNLTTGLTGFVLPAAVIWLVRGFGSNPGRFALRRGLTAGLLLLTGLIHLALMPEHLSVAPLLGILFALDGVAFVIVAAASFKNSWLRGPTVALLSATILAYLFMVASGREGVDDLGVVTKLIELLALGLVIWPETMRVDWRWSVAAGSLVLAVTATGGLAWAASLRVNGTGHTHDGKVVLAAAPPTDAQRAAAARLIDDTRAGIDKYTDLQVALADGYRPSTPPAAPTVHYVNQGYRRAGRILDPTRPEALVYANTRRGPMLLGAMYMMPRANMQPPDFGGSLAEWHTHPNICFTLPRFGIDGLESPFGTCPVGSLNGPTPAMLHVWTVANPAGPFADLNPAYVARLTRGDA